MLGKIPFQQQQATSGHQPDQGDHQGRGLHRNRAAKIQSGGTACFGAKTRRPISLVPASLD